MMRKVWIGAGIVVVVVAAAAGIALTVFRTQFRQAASVLESATMSEEDVAEQSEENAQADRDIRQKYSIPDFELTDDMRAAIADGSMTLEEATRQIMAQAAQPQSDAVQDAAQPAESADSAPEPEQEPVTEPEPQPVTEPDAVEPVTQPDNNPEPAQTEPVTTTEPQPAAEVSEPAETDLNSYVAAQAGGSQDTAQPVTQPDSDPEPAATPDPEPVTDTQQGSSAAETPTQEDEDAAKLQSLVAQMYVLRDTFTAQVYALLQECIDEYNALDPSEWTTANRIRIVSARLGDISAMEANCDAQVADIVKQIREIDPELADEAQSRYESEKSVTKASIIAQYR